MEGENYNLAAARCQLSTRVGVSENREIGLSSVNILG